MFIIKKFLRVWVPLSLLALVIYFLLVVKWYFASPSTFTTQEAAKKRWSSDSFPNDHTLDFNNYGHPIQDLLWNVPPPDGFKDTSSLLLSKDYKRPSYLKPNVWPTKKTGFKYLLPQAEVEQSILPPRVMNGIKYFTFFVGAGRSGTTIVGALLDAHPSVILARDYCLFTKWPQNADYHCNRTLLYGALHAQQIRQAIDLAKTHYHIPTGFMGKYEDHVTVIGEKEAGTATAWYHANATIWKAILYELKHTVDIPVKLVQVVRNPYDQAATMYRNKARNPTPEITLKNLFNNMQAVYEMKNNLQLDIHEVHLPNLVNNPQEELQKLCNYFELECSPSYIKVCMSKLYKQVHRTRAGIRWTPALKKIVENATRTFPWYRDYTFESD